MRLLHTSDWHIGMAYNKLDRTAYLEHAFAQIKALAIDEKVDLILNTGDLFDTGIPALEPLQYGWRVLEDLSQIAPVVVLCGNHDAAKLFELMGMLVGDRCNVHFVGLTNLVTKRERSVLQIPTRDGAQIMKIGSVPFVKEATYIERILEADPDRATLKYADEVGRIEELVGRWLDTDYNPNRDVKIFAAHLLVDQATVSQQAIRPMYIERDFATHPHRIPPADYVAF
ncbi:MAG: metallophosphoesterase family protein, partial [Thermoanaerobaculia bacterium]